jgi:hypothetical protein
MDGEVPSRPQKRPVKKQKLNKKTTPVVEKKAKSSPRKTNTVTRQKKVCSRTSTPQPERPVAATAAAPATAPAALTAPLCEFVRETSPPAKVRFPSPRMTIPEMNKRANQILDSIFTIQIDMGAAAGLSESECDEQRRGRRPTPILIPEKMDDHSSPSSSLSSASTIPLEESDALIGEKGVAQETLDRMRHKELTSMEILHYLTTDLLNFKRRFGSAGDDDNSIESECGPTTRSRELSHRSFMERAW